MEIEKRYADYLNSVRGELIAAEATVARIKHSKEWQDCTRYFNVLACRGKIEQRPTKENQYTFK